MDLWSVRGFGNYGAALERVGIRTGPVHISTRLSADCGWVMNRDGSLIRFQKANNAISHISTVLKYKTL